MKKIIALILCVILACGLLAGCGSGGSSAPASSGSSGSSAPAASSGSSGSGQLVQGSNTQDGGETKVELPVETAPPEAEYYDEISVYLPDGLPVVSHVNKGFSGLCVTHICFMVWDRLIQFVPDSTWNPELATEWEMSEDGFECRIKIRDDVYFHNGEHMTSDDVYFTVMELAKAEENTGTHLQRAWKEVVAMDILGDYEFVFHLKEANQDFCNKTLTGTTAIILSRKAFADDPETAPMIGTGPWKITAFEPMVSLSLERFDDYFGEKALAKTCIMRTVPEQTAKDIMMKNGELTFGEISGMYVKEYLDLGFNIYQVTNNNCEYLSFNQNKPLMQDKNFRLACAYAINKQAIIDVAVDGCGELPKAIFYGYGTAYRNPDIKPIDYNLELAKEYLAKSSYKGETIKLSACIDRCIKAAQMVQEQLMAIGIDVDLNIYDQGGLNQLTGWDNMSEDLLCHSGAMGSVGTAMDGYTMTGQGNNVAHWSNPEYDELLIKAKATKDGPERQALYYKAQEIYADAMPMFTLYHLTQYYACAPGAGGCIPYPSTYVDWSHCYRVKQ